MTEESNTMTLSDWMYEAERRKIPPTPGPVVWMTCAEREEVARLCYWNVHHIPGETFLGMRVCLIDRPPINGTAGWFHGKIA